MLSLGAIAQGFMAAWALLLGWMPVAWREESLADLKPISLVNIGEGFRDFRERTQQRTSSDADRAGAPSAFRGGPWTLDS
jgi:hypothetical protein